MSSRRPLSLWLSTWRAEVAIAVVTLAYTAWAWGISGSRPGVRDPGGYSIWVDQRFYIAEADALAHFRLPAAADYWYGLGYPIIGVPFRWLGIAADPLLIPDLILTAATMVLVFRLAIRLSGRRPLAWAVVGILLIATPLMQLAVVPWSTAVTLFTTVAGMLIVTRPYSRWGGFWLGLLTGWAFAARYIDVIGMGVIAGFYLLLHVRRRPTSLIWMAAPAVVILLLVLASQWAVFGSPLITPYHSHLDPVTGSPDQSVESYTLTNIPRHFVQTFLTGWDSVLGGARVPNVDPLLFTTPVLLLAPVGAVLVLRRRTDRALHVVFLVSTLVQAGIYLAFRAGGGIDLQYNNARYWISSYPYWLILAAIGTAAAIARLERPARADGDAARDRDDTMSASRLEE